MADTQWYERLGARVSVPVREALKTGLAPREVALALALGTWLGLFPLYFGTTLVCVAVAWRLRLNHAVIQVGNFGASPLQVLLLYPFFKAGSLLFGGEPLGLPAPDLRAQLMRAPTAALRHLSHGALHAVVIWMLLGLILVPLLWWVFTALLKRLEKPGAGGTPA